MDEHGVVGRGDHAGGVCGCDGLCVVKKIFYALMFLVYLYLSSSLSHSSGGREREYCLLSGRA